MKLFNSLSFAVIFSIFTLPIMAQTIVVPEDLEGDQQTWIVNLNGSQASYDNWSEGGVNTISGTFSTIFTHMYRKDKFGYGFRANLRYGQSRIDGETRKSDDLIALRGRGTYGFSETSKFAGYGAIMLRSQFTDGYEYGAKTNPAGADSLISGLFAPAYLTEGAGISYQANSELMLEAGLALKQTFVSDGDLAPNYGMDSGDTFRSEGGLTTGISYQTDVAENIKYASNLETFTNFLIPVSETDVYWTNELVGQINSIVSASFQFELRYDHDFSEDLQIKQVLSAGISVNLY